LITIGRARLLTQFLTLIIVNLGFTQVLKSGIVCPVFFCYGCPWASVACPIGVLQNYTALGAFPFYALGTLGLAGLAVGRGWCGWACPFGAIQDLVARIRRNDAAKLPPVPLTKYLSLGGILIAAWLLTDSAFCKVCPGGSIFASIPHRFASPEFPFGTFFYVHIATLAVTLILVFLFARFWCRYLCPLGAILGAFNRTGLVKIRLDRSRCTECQNCLKSCPGGIGKVEDIGNGTDCTQCARCVEKCPVGALKISAGLRN